MPNDRTGARKEKPGADTARAARSDQSKLRPSQSQRWPTILTTWKTPFYDRVFNVGGFLITLLGAIATIVLASNENDRRSAALISTSIAATMLAILVYSLVRQLWTATNEIARSRMTETAASKIADSFCELVARQSEFEGAVAAYIVKYLEHNLVEKDYDKVGQVCFDFIEALVNTATYVISTKKGNPTDTCAANFKLFLTREGTREVVYKVFYRSPHAPKNRHDADRLARENNDFPLLDSNRIYSTVLKTREPFIEGNLPEYVAVTTKLNEANRRLDRPTFSEPSMDTIDDYTSCLLVPVHGTDILLRLLRNKTHDGILPFGQEGSLVGLFCIDSKQPDYFDSDYDRSVMTQLASHAFSAIRTFYAVGAMRDTYGKLNESPSRPHS
jgi:hypothetical protein